MSRRRWTLVIGLAAAIGAWATLRKKPTVVGAIRRGSMAARNAELARMGVAVGATYASASARKLFATAERRVEIDRELELKSAAQVSERLGQMKGALMKLGQMASYLDEGLPAPLRAALAQLQSSAPPMSADLAAEVIERELGAAPDRVFVEWDPDPIAAASIDGLAA